MSEYRWSSPAAIQTSLGAGLNALADGSNVLSAAIDNTTNRKTFITVEVVLASVDLSSQTNPTIYVWFVKEIDGSNFEDGAAAVDPPAQPDIVIPLREVSGAQRVITTNVVFFPYNVKLLFANRAGAALAASGNTLKYRLHSMENN